jgi:hypothetical protein
MPNPAPWLVITQWLMVTDDFTALFGATMPYCTPLNVKPMRVLLTDGGPL